MDIEHGWQSLFVFPLYNFNLDVHFKTIKIFIWFTGWNWTSINLDIQISKETVVHGGFRPGDSCPTKLLSKVKDNFVMWQKPFGYSSLEQLLQNQVKGWRRQDGKWWCRRSSLMPHNLKKISRHSSTFLEKFTKIFRRILNRKETWKGILYLCLKNFQIRIAMPQ